MFTGILSTLLIPETNQKTLEMLSNESQDDFIQRESTPCFSAVAGDMSHVNLPSLAVPASDYAGSGYLSDFEPTPIRLNPLESPSSPSRPPTAFSARGRRKGTSVSSHGERYASMSDLSVNS